MFLFAWTTVAHAQASALRVTVADTTPREVDPGASVGAVFVLQSSRTTAVAADVRVELPERWRAITGTGRTTVDARESQLRVVTVAVPANAPAGAQRVTLVASPDGEERPVRGSLTIVVRERRQLAVRVRQAPEFVSAGESFEAAFVVSNVGNAVAKVRASARASEGLSVATDSFPLTLAPGESRTIGVSGRARATQPTGPQFVRVRIQAVGATAARDMVVATAPLTILPAPAKAGDMIATVPTTLTVRGGRAESGSAQASHGLEWSGAAPLGEGSNTRVDFLTRWSSSRLTPTGQRNELRLALSRPGFALQLGDQLYALSPLTVPGRLGTGAGVRVEGHSWALGGFTDRSPWSGVEREERAGFVRVRGGGAEAGLQYVAFGRGDSPGGQAATAQASLALGRLARADAELGRGLDTAGGQAWRLALAGEAGMMSYDLRLLHADTTFPGSVGGADARSGRISLHPLPMVRLSATRDEHEAARTAWRSSQEWDTRATKMSAAVGDHVRVSYRVARRSGDLADRSIDARERAGELEVNARHGALQLAGFAEAGAFDGGATAGSNPIRGLRVEASDRLLAGISIAGWMARYEGRSLRNWSAETTTSGGLTADIARGRTRLHAGVGLDAMSADGPGQALRLDLEAARRLPLGHELALQVRTGSGGVGALSAATVQLDYRLPLAAPVGLRRDVGRLEVEVTNAESGRPVPGVVLRVGATTIMTGRDGGTGAVALPEGILPLRIERVGAADMVPNAPLPSTVAVAGGRTTRLRVALVRAARLTGRVRRYAFSGSLLERRSLFDSSGVASLLVTLRLGTEVLQQVTDADGAFAFDQMRPGLWRVSVSGALPGGVALERQSADVTLTAGRAEVSTWRVLPNERPVRITTESELLAAPAATPPRMPAPAAASKARVAPKRRPESPARSARPAVRSLDSVCSPVLLDCPAAGRRAHKPSSSHCLTPCDDSTYGRSPTGMPLALWWCDGAATRWAPGKDNTNQNGEPMRSRKLTTGLLALTFGLLAACGEDAPQIPVAPNATARQAATAPVMSRATAKKGKLNGLERQKALKEDVSASAVIGAEGGVLTLPATGLRLVVPAGAVSRPTPFRATAIAGRLVAYDFEPAGSTFPVPLRVEQDLSFLKRRADASPVVAGYFPSRTDLDQDLLAGRVAEVISTSPSATTVSFPVWHFSGYVVGWGFRGDDSF